MPVAAHTAVTAGIVDALSSVAREPHLLEVGIGTGRIAVPLAEAGVQVVGVDVAREMLARLRARRSELPVVRAAATPLPFRANAFDGVLFVHVLHLLGDPGAALRAAHGVLRPGGLLLYGQQGFRAGPVREAAAMMREIVAELAGIELEIRLPNPRANESFAAHARSAGVEPVSSLLATWTDHVTGRRLLDHIAGRVWSSTWAIPDAVMPELLHRLAPRLEALVGDLDRPVESKATFTLSIVGPVRSS